MIKIECGTTDYAVMKAVEEMFAKLAARIPESERGFDVGSPFGQLLTGTAVKPCACESVTVSPVTEQPIAAPPVTEQPIAAPPVTEQPIAAPPVTEQPIAAPPVTEQPIAAPPVTGVELDSSGLPWDERINVSTKTLRQSDNTWKLLRGIEQSLVDSVKAELKAARVAAPPVTEQPIAAPPVTEQPIAAPPVTATTVASGVPTTFPGFLSAFTFRQSKGRITTDEVNVICQGLGLASLPLIASRPDLIPAVFEQMEAICLTRP